MSRRVMALVLAVLLVGGLADALVAPDVATAASNPIPRLRVTPDCADPAILPPTTFGSFDSSLAVAPQQATPQQAQATGLQLRFRGSGFDPRTRLRVIFGPDGAFVRNVRADELGTFDFRKVVPSPFAKGTFMAGVVVRGSGSNKPVASAPVVFPCSPSIDVSTSCRRGASRLRDLEVSGIDFPASTVVAIRLVDLGSGAQRELAEVSTGSDGGFAWTFERPGSIAPGTYRIIAVPPGSRGASAAVEILEVPCPRPAASVDPRCGPAGPPTTRMDIAVSASGFSPGARVLVIWDPARSHEVWVATVSNGGTVDVEISPLRRTSGRYRVRVIQGDASQTPAATLAAPPQIPRRLASDIFVAPCPTETRDADLEVTPRCDRPALAGDAASSHRLRVSGAGFEPGRVTVVFDAGGADEEHRIRANAAGSFRLDITTDPRPVGRYRITASQTTSIEATGGELIVTGETTFVTPCDDLEPPPLVLEPACGQAAVGQEGAYQIEVQGTGFYQDGLVVLEFGAGARAETDSVRADGDGSFSKTLVVDGRRREAYGVSATQRDSSRPGVLVASSSATFSVPCPFEPRIEIEPAAGPPGYAAVVTGSDFPPGMPVSLAWDRGIEAGRSLPVEVAPDGTFRMFIFILPNDFAGERTLTAVVDDEFDRYPDASDDYTVVLGSAAPPSTGDEGSFQRR
jgi:hypothetical protein